MRASIIGSIDRPERIVAIEQVGQSLIVASSSSAARLERATLVPLLTDLEIEDFKQGWAFTATAMVALDGTTVPLSELVGLSLVRFTPLHEGGFLVAFANEKDRSAAGVARIDHQGHVVWMTRATPPATLSGVVSDARASEGWVLKTARPWTPGWWLIHDGHLGVSGDRAFAVFHDSSGLGLGYGLDLDTGRLVFQTEPAPWSELCAAPEAGSFLAGVQGYGAFETRLIDRTGAVRRTWPSHGRVVPGEPLRLIELDNTVPSTCRVATLDPSGAVRHGPNLTGYYTSPVIAAADGGSVFWRDGVLQSLSRDGTRLESLSSVAPLQFVSALGGTVPGIIAFAGPLDETPDDRVRTRTRLFVYELSAS
ncbi:MAG: hypothetical protein Q8N26_08135 [Myxococcales bacterium]|nr:hypothetical protein [Myxococcales bacterium]